MAVSAEELTELVKQLFTALDKDGSGFLEKAECHELATKIYGKMTEGKEDAKPFNEEKFEKGFANLDKSGDGKLSFDEVNTVIQNFAKNKGLVSE